MIEEPILSPHHFRFIKDLVYHRTGQNLNAQSRYFIETHLNDFMKNRTNFLLLSDFVDFLIQHPTSSLAIDVNEAFLIHETSFFRDEKVFDYLKETLLPKIFKNLGKNQKASFWSAACSFGQEPYSLVMLLDSIGFCPSSYSLLASDFSFNALKKAQMGFYNQFEVQRGLRINHLLQYFNQNGSSWHIKSDLRKSISFCHINLVDDFNFSQKFDLILCRNVLIYFNDETKSKVINTLLKHLNTDGKIILGSTETLLNIPSVPALKTEGFGVWGR